MNNLLAYIPANLPHELFQALLTTPDLRIERILSRGHASPEGVWLDQEEHEWVLLLQGAARLCFENSAATVEMKAGSWIYIPAHQRHRVDWTDPSQVTIWLAVHYRDEA
ncbi:MAG: cupin domain-containing protein [Phycisphaerales bacterium]|nr:cupin domain-containing protein [Phycisphaerales bacterium]